MEKPVETAHLGPKVGGYGVSENHQGRINGDSQVDGNSDLASIYWLLGGKAQQKKKKNQWRLPALLSGRKLTLQL